MRNNRRSPRAAALLLALAVFLSLPGTHALADGGGRDDPLLTLSYVSEYFLSEISEKIQSLIDARRGSVSSSKSDLPAISVVTVYSGGSAVLGEGETIILLSGSARAQVNGALVNATSGTAAYSGKLNPGQRYISCEGSTVTVAFSEDSTAAVSGGVRVNAGEKTEKLPFTDVGADDWFFSSVAGAYKQGYINGVSADSFDPGGSLTYAQTIKLAACIHQKNAAGSVTLQNSAAGPWYKTYADYCLANGIISREPESYSAAVTRRDFVAIFYRALPGSSYTEINSVAANGIPDIPATDENAYEIYAFYRAGILTGYSDGSFSPGGAISRAEASAIVCRMTDKAVRVKIQ